MHSYKKINMLLSQPWRKHIRRQYLSIVDTDRREATSEIGCQPFFVPTGCFSHMAWTLKDKGTPHLARYTRPEHRCPLSPKFQFYFKNGSSNSYERRNFESVDKKILSKGGFTRRAKAGDNNQQTADDVKTAIPRPFTRTR